MALRTTGERRAPLCAFSMQRLVEIRRDALARCAQEGLPPAAVYDVLRRMVSELEAGLDYFYFARPADAVPFDAKLDARFRRELALLEREAKALNATAGDSFRRGVDMPGVGVALSAQERTVEAIESRNPKVRKKAGKKVRKKAR